MPLYPARSGNGFATALRSFLAYPTQALKTELIYTTVDGDMVDDIAETHYGFPDGGSEAIFARNPWLARYDAILPAGLDIILPVIEVAPTPFLWTY